MMRKNNKAGIIFLWIIICLFFGLSCRFTNSILNLIPDSREDLPAMAFVVDPNYNPIAYASMGTNNLLTDRYGVAIGEITADESGWVLVQAPGYVSNYVKPSQFSREYDLYFVTLVPVEAGAFYEKSYPTNLWLGDSETPKIQIEITPGSLQTEEAILELTEIHPREISMDDFWGDLDDTYSPLISFDLSAYDISGEAVGLAENNLVTVSIFDEENDIDDLVLQSFDPESGNWIVQEDACSRIDEQTIECSLSHFSFHSFMDKNLGPEDMDSMEFDTFKDTYNEISKMFKEGGDNSKDLQDALERLAEAAKEFAKTHRDESGKAMLMYATDAAMGSGIEGSEALAQDLTKEAQDLTAEMMKKLAENPNCGNMYELMHIMDQGMRLGGSAEAEVQNLKDKVGDRFDNCEIWAGTVRYMFFPLDYFPDLEEKWKLVNNQSWHEIHTVTIGINRVTKHLDGDSYVKLNFPTASYLAEVGGGDCGPDKAYIDINTGAGNGFTWLVFEGTYDGTTFQLGPMEEKESGPVDLSWHSHGLFGCPKTEKDFGKVPMFPYHSQLLYGFFGQPQPPDLEEMLNTGLHCSGDGSVCFSRGSQEISYSSGVNRPEIIPINKA
ncbi:MAG: hypothetical protein MUP11_00335, partial [Anaerolineales bacterium]|nr:hypothetical protein [Anaerolineales bacterium]